MAVPTVYTEDELADYMIGLAGEIATQKLGWTIDDLYEAVNDTLLAYGETDISLITGATNIRYLRLLARRELWKAIMQATAHEFSFGAALPGSTNTSRQQLHEHAKQMFYEAQIELSAEFGTNDVSRVVGIATVDYSDPYSDEDITEANEWSRIDRWAPAA